MDTSLAKRVHTAYFEDESSQRDECDDWEEVLDPEEHSRKDGRQYSSSSSQQSSVMRERNLPFSAHPPPSPLSSDWTLVSPALRERSESVFSTVSSYSYPSSSCTEDAWNVVDHSVIRQTVRNGRDDELERFESAIAASLVPAPNSPSTGRKNSTEPVANTECFFSSSGASTDLQLRVATFVTSLACLNALHSTCKWLRCCVWQAKTQKDVIYSGKARHETLPLAEAAAASILIDQLGFSACLPATTKTAGYAKRLALCRAVVLVPPKASPCFEYLTVSRKAITSIDFLLEDVRRLTTRIEQSMNNNNPANSRSESKLSMRQFESPRALQVAAARELLGLVALRGRPDGMSPWRAFLLDMDKTGVCRLSFPPNFEGWTRSQGVRRVPFPAFDHVASSSLLPCLDLTRWHALVCTDDFNSNSSHSTTTKSRKAKVVSTSNLASFAPSMLETNNINSAVTTPEDSGSRIRHSISSPSLLKYSTTEN